MFDEFISLVNPRKQGKDIYRGVFIILKQVFKYIERERERDMRVLRGVTLPRDLLGKQVIR